MNIAQKRSLFFFESNIYLELLQVMKVMSLKQVLKNMFQGCLKSNKIVVVFLNIDIFFEKPLIVSCQDSNNFF